MKKLPRWLPLLAMLVVTAILAFVIRDFVRQVIVLPVVYVGWYGWIILSNLPYWIFWGVLLLVVLGVAAASLRRPEEARRPAPPPEARPQGPVTTWYRQLEQAATSVTAERRLARSLGQVLWRARYPDLPYNEALFLQHVDRDSGGSGAGDSGPGHRGALNLTPAMRAYFHAGLQRETPTLTRRWWRRKDDYALAIAPDDAIAFLEAQLNPSHVE